MRRAWKRRSAKSGARVRLAPLRLEGGSTTIVRGGVNSPLTCLGRRLHQVEKFDERAWFEELYSRFSKPGVWVLYDDVVRCLDRLANRFRLAVVSNFDRRLRHILDDLGVASRFERLFISSEIGCEKPHPAIFRQALEVMEVEPERCLHIGDDPERDWAGAAAAGIAVFKLRRPEVSLDDLGVTRV